MPIWRNWIARWTSNPEATGSSPVMGKYIFSYLFVYIYKV